MRPYLQLLSAGLIGALASAAFTTRPATAAPGGTFEDRLAELERVVVKDPSHPNTAVVDRLDAVEKSLKLSGGGDLKTPDDLKAAVLRNSAENDDLDRRLKAIERAQKPADTAGLQRSIDQLSRELDRQKQEIRDLSSRISRFKM